MGLDKTGGKAERVQHEEKGEECEGGGNLEHAKRGWFVEDGGGTPRQKTMVYVTRPGAELCAWVMGGERWTEEGAGQHGPKIKTRGKILRNSWVTGRAPDAEAGGKQGFFRSWTMLEYDVKVGHFSKEPLLKAEGATSESVGFLAITPTPPSSTPPAQSQKLSLSIVSHKGHWV